MGMFLKKIRIRHVCRKRDYTCMYIMQKSVLHLHIVRIPFLFSPTRVVVPATQGSMRSNSGVCSRGKMLKISQDARTIALLQPFKSQDSRKTSERNNRAALPTSNEMRNFTRLWKCTMVLLYRFHYENTYKSQGNANFPPLFSLVAPLS